jgi:Icc-related predicted phosphoesterase
MIHCGDFTNKHNPYENELEARNFLEWYKILPIKNKVLVCGNHDGSCFKGLVKKEEYPELIWLEHETANVEGLNIFGSPYTPRFGDWYYTYKRNIAKVYWDHIPNNIDILVTHGPAKTILDLTEDKETNNLVQVGCKSLYNRVMEVKPVIHCFGHIHQEKNCNNYGIYQKSISDTKFINASCLNHHTGEINQGHIVYI